MLRYLDQGILEPHQGMIYVERTVGGKTRRGIVLCLDLERYDYTRGSTSLIRATEGTIVERIPPRMKIRMGAKLELPHILVLIDDPGRTVLEPLEGEKSRLEKLYDFDLMLDSGHLAGYGISPAMEGKIVAALRRLVDPQVFSTKYGVEENTPTLLFAMGDGNHSLATAKATWEQIRTSAGMDHPARYALVEIENVHDEGLEFEPIHRLVFDVKADILEAMTSALGELSYEPVSGAEEMVRSVEEQHGPQQVIGVVEGGKRSFGLVKIAQPTSNLPVGSLQGFLDPFLKNGGAGKIDYVHGEEVVVSLGLQPGNVGFYVPGMNKSDLFKTVILDGALPRKTFSMGEAKEKRFYMEARKIL